MSCAAAQSAFFTAGMRNIIHKGGGLGGGRSYCCLSLIHISMAKALSRHGGYRVFGSDLDPAAVAWMQETGAIKGVADTAAMSQADLVVLALPPGACGPVLREILDVLRPGSVVTDVCGVKSAVMDACLPLCREHRLLFVGGHPMAGRERGGWQNATHNLFRGASYIFTPPEGTPEYAMDTLRALAAALGCASVTITTPAHHDRQIAFTSQLPHVLAGAYVQSPVCPGHKGYSAGSYRDVSRVAAVDEILWSELFALNQVPLIEELDGLIARLETARAAIASGDRDEIAAVIRRGRLVKEALGE